MKKECQGSKMNRSYKDKESAMSLENSYNRNENGFPNIDSLGLIY